MNVHLGEGREAEDIELEQLCYLHHRPSHTYSAAVRLLVTSAVSTSTRFIQVYVHLSYTSFAVVPPRFPFIQNLQFCSSNMMIKPTSRRLADEPKSSLDATTYGISLV